MSRRAALIGSIVVSLFARGALAQDALSSEANAELRGLRAQGPAGVSTLVEGGVLAWAGGLAEPAASADPATAARAFLGRHGALFGVADAAGLEVVTANQVAGTSYVRLRPTHLGRPVLGAQVVVAIRGGEVRHVASGLRPWVGPAAMPATIAAADAAAAVRASSGRGAIVPGPGDLAWLPLGNDLLPVWVVTQREVLHDWRYVVEATTGAVLSRADQHRRIDGYVYDTNPVTAGGVTTRVALPGLADGATVLEGDLARSFRCVEETGDCTGWGGDCRTCGLSEHRAVAQADGHFLYEPDEPSYEDPFSEVMGYYHASAINQFFGDVLGFQHTCAGSDAITIYVNQHVPGGLYEQVESGNAFYGDADGDGCGDLVLGEGGYTIIDFAYDGEVIYHEFTHGMVEQAGGLGCMPFGACNDSLGVDWVPLGLNEGFADYFSVTFADDPVLGEHSWLAFPGEPNRRADNEHMCPFELNGESHYDGQILSGTGWDIRLVVGNEVADRMMTAVMLSLPSNASYAQLAGAIAEQAQAELAAGAITADQVAEIDQIMGPERRAITGCRRIVPLDAIPEGHHTEFMILSTYRGGMTLPGGLQYSLTTPRRATELQFELQVGSYQGMRLPPSRVTAHVRRGDPVEVDITFNPATYQLEVDFVDDFAVDVTDEPLVLDAASDPAIEPETVYYIAIEYACPDGCMLRARGSVEGDPNQVPTAVAGDDQTVVEGESVTVDGSASSDPDGDVLVFGWTQLSGPTVTLDAVDAAQATFVAAEAGTVELQLTVTDPEGGADRDTVAITVTPRPDDELDGGPDADPDADAQPVMQAAGGGCDCGAASRSSSLTAALRSLLSL